MAAEHTIRPPVPGTTESPDVVQIILNDYLGRLRWQFYPDNPKAFFSQRKMLIRAITYPAAWLSKRGVTWPPDQYREVLNEVIRTIQHHGATANIACFPKYFLHCVQQHMAHREEQYYDLGKSHRAKMDAISAQFLRSLTVQERPQDADLVETLATIHQVIKPGPGRRKSPKPTPAPPAGPIQQSLF